MTEKDIQRWIMGDDKLPHLVIFTEKKTVPALLKTLSIEFKDRAALGVVLAGSEGLAQKMGVPRRRSFIDPKRLLKNFLS